MKVLFLKALSDLYIIFNYNITTSFQLLNNQYYEVYHSIFLGYFFFTCDNLSKFEKVTT